MLDLSCCSQVIPREFGSVANVFAHLAQLHLPGLPNTPRLGTATRPVVSCLLVYISHCCGVCVVLTAHGCGFLANPHLRVLNLSGSPGLITAELVHVVATTCGHSMRTLLLGVQPGRDTSGEWLVQEYVTGQTSHVSRMTHSQLTDHLPANGVPVPSLTDEAVAILSQGCPSLQHLSLAGHHRLTDAATRYLVQLTCLSMVRFACTRDPSWRELTLAVHRSTSQTAA